MGAFIRNGTGWDSKLYASGLTSFINSKELETRLFKAVILADRERIVDLFIMLLTETQREDIGITGNTSRISKNTNESTCDDLRGKPPTYSLEKRMEHQLISHKQSKVLRLGPVRRKYEQIGKALQIFGWKRKMHHSYKEGETELQHIEEINKWIFY